MIKIKLKIIYGPPCSGKTTYVKDNIKDGDIVIDLDYLKHAMTYKDYHDDLEGDELDYLWDIRNHLIKNPKSNCTTYLISITDDIPDTDVYTDTETIEMEVTKEEIYEYIENDDDREDKEFWKNLVDEWFEDNSKEVKNIKESKIKNKFKVVNETDSSKLYLQGTIGESWYYEDSEKDNIINSKRVKKALKNLRGKEIDVHINSGGGDVFESIAIGNLLKQHDSKVNIIIDGLAGSGASIVAMAGDTVTMFPNSTMMVHNASTFAYGNKEEFLKVAEDLGKIDTAVKESYKSRFIGTEEELISLIDEETWLTAEECKTLGFCDIVKDEAKPKEKPKENIKNTILGKYAAKTPEDPKESLKDNLIKIYNKGE